MKYAILVPDGMADYPHESLGNRTPLEVAHTPNMDAVASAGILGQVATIPPGMAPASDVANMSILGYDHVKYYTGRGPLEAANLGVNLAEDDVAFRCNLITAGEDLMLDYSAGHISSKEAEVLIEFLNWKLRNSEYRFYHGVSYRHLFVIKDNCRSLDKIKCTPPHDILNQKLSKFLPRGRNSEVLVDLMNASREILPDHEINKVRLDLKENPANMIWFWGQGKKANMPTYFERFQKTGAVISAVDLIKGLGRILGLDVINVPGATGYYDTDYLAKADYAINALRSKDFVFVHMEATDEAGHNGEAREKIAAIEKFDSHIVGSFLKHFQQTRDDFRILVLPDHATPLSVRTHVSDPVCFVLSGKGVEHNGFSQMSEKLSKDSKVKFSTGVELVEFFFKGEG